MNLHSIDSEEILAQSENSLSLKIFISKESDYFDGHFPSFKLLPAVAQVDLVSRFSNKYFRSGRSVLKIKRMKFTAPLLPETTIQLDLTAKKEKNMLNFSIYEFGNPEKSFSTGSFVIK